MSDPKLEAFLIREGRELALYFCRGDGKCTKSALDKMRMSRLHKKCPDCIKPPEGKTIGEVLKQLERGDA